MNSKTNRPQAKGGLLIALCWLVYATSYVTKLSYNANISQIGDAFGVSYSEAGTVPTFFFFAYGIGQVVNGILCKKYNIRLVIFFCLLGSAAANFAIPFLSEFAYIKYVWLINGILLSFLWTSIIRLLSETLPTTDIKRAIVIMGTTVATGTFTVYGLSSLFAAYASFRTVFIVAAALCASVALLWLILYKRLVTPLAEKRCESIKEAKLNGGTGFFSSGLFPLISVLALFCIANNFVKDGLTAWTPDILKSTYGTPDWLSIFLTLLLPLLAISGAFVAVKLQGVTKSFIGSCTVLFAISGLLTGLVILLLSTSLLPLTVASFAIVSCLMASANDILTSMVPLSLRDKIPSGKLAGILNGFCYLGSTASSYTLGVIADAFDWRAVFITLFFVTCLMVLTGGTYLIIRRLKKQA